MILGERLKNARTSKLSQGKLREQLITKGGGEPSAQSVQIYQKLIS